MNSMAMLVAGCFVFSVSRNRREVNGFLGN